MSKRKSKQTNQVHPTRSFDQMVADATTSKMKDFIMDQINRLAQGLMARQQQGFANAAIRTVAIEEILLEKLNISKEQLVDRVSAVQDRSEGFDAANDEVKQGDRVRLEIKTRTADQTEYAGTSRLLVDNAGSGATLGSEIEPAILGMTQGQTKEITFGKDGSLHASITVNKISRQAKVEEEIQDATEVANDSNEG